jgi:hypothetical protein
MLRKAGMQPQRYKLGFFGIELPGLVAAVRYLPLPNTPRSKFSSAISPGSRKRAPRLVSFVTLLSASAVRGLAVRQRREDECQSF